MCYHTGDTLHSEIGCSSDSVNHHNLDKTEVSAGPAMPCLQAPGIKEVPDMLTKMGNCEHCSIDRQVLPNDDANILSGLFNAKDIY